jgi:4,5-dihydroxyphthalate decarboxylase
VSTVPVINLGIQRFDRTDALHDGRIRAPGVHVSHVLPAVSVLGLLGGAFDAAEIPLAHYTLLRGLGEPYTALPVFPDRLFLQQYAYTRRGSGINGLGDLRGCRVGVPMYFMTSSVWHRGFLHEATGIRPEEITWITTSPERDARVPIPPGVQVSLQPGSHLGLELLLDGDVDCLMTEAMPRMTEAQRQDVVPVFHDPHKEQVEFFRQRQIHPIVHVIALRNDLLDRRPDAFETLCRAFDSALQASYDLAQNERMVTLPLMRSYLDETSALFGSSPWPYGLHGRNVAELELFLRFSADQGLTRRQLSLEELFDQDAFRYRFTAEMGTGADLGDLRSLRGIRDLN